MPKRLREPGEYLSRPSKRLKYAQDRLSILSDEILLRIIAYLPEQTLATCHRVSRRLKSIAGDPQIWKRAYYESFVLPRWIRAKRRRTPAKTYLGAARLLANWVEELDFPKHGREVDWMRQFKIRHNWSMGSARTSDIPVAEKPPIPPLIARLHNGVVYTADALYGLRIWSYRDDKSLLAAQPLHADPQYEKKPTSMALNAAPPIGGHQKLAIGFQDGSFSILRYSRSDQVLSPLHSDLGSPQGLLTAIAFASPYVLTMNESQTLSLYRLPEATGNGNLLSRSEGAHLLAFLNSRTAWPPLSLSIQRRERSILASIAYCVSDLGGSWSTGIQELWFSESGALSNSRLASANSSSFRPIFPKEHGANLGFKSASRISQRSTEDRTLSRPTSLSYTHPYLLVTHSDNTLTLYLVNSTNQSLSIGAGKRLWGHTSSVMGAHVGKRGKAVSVTSRGDEIRVWELEGSLASADLGTIPLDEEATSIRVTPEDGQSTPTRLRQLSKAMHDRGSGLGLGLQSSLQQPTTTRGWVGFDEENVVVLREQMPGQQALTVYDFT